MKDSGDPARLNDPQARAPEALRNLFTRAEHDLPTGVELDRLAARLAPVFASAAPAPAPAPAPALPAARPALVWGLGVAGVVAAGAVVWLSRSGAPPDAGVAPRNPATAPAPLAAPTAAEAPAVAPSASPASEPSSAESASALPRASGAPAPHRAQPSEAALLEQARRALASDPARALSLTRQHQQRFPNGILNQEREVIAIEALRRLGKGNEASERAGSFEKQYPDSAHRRAVESGAGK